MNLSLGPQQAMLFWEVVEAFIWGSTEESRSPGGGTFNYCLAISSCLFSSWLDTRSSVLLSWCSVSPQAQSHRWLWPRTSEITSHIVPSSELSQGSVKCSKSDKFNEQNWGKGEIREEGRSRKMYTPRSTLPWVCWGPVSCWLGEAVYICPGWPLNSTQLRAEVRPNRLVRNAWQMSMLFSSDVVSSRCWKGHGRLLWAWLLKEDCCLGTPPSQRGLISLWFLSQRSLETWGPWLFCGVFIFLH